MTKAVKVDSVTVEDKVDLKKKMKKSKDKDKVKKKITDDLDVPAVKREMSDEKNDPTEKKDLSFSKNHESEVHVKSGETVSVATFETSLQKKRVEKSKQKRKEKKMKLMAKQKPKVAKKKQTKSGVTAKMLWDKLNQTKKEPVKVEKQAEPEIPVNYSIEDEPDPVRKAMRELKREKRQKRKSERTKKLQESIERAGTAGISSIEYLNQWENNREEWKFNKRRQTWLIRNLYDQEKIPDGDFDILLRYLDPANDSTKESLVKEAEEVIRNIEKELEKEGDTDGVQVVSNHKMDRARQIIQLLAT